MIKQLPLYEITLERTIQEGMTFKEDVDILAPDFKTALKWAEKYYYEKPPYKGDPEFKTVNVKILGGAQKDVWVLYPEGEEEDD